MLKIEKIMVNTCQECTHVVSDETGEAVPWQKFIVSLKRKPI